MSAGALRATHYLDPIPWQAKTVLQAICYAYRDVDEVCTHSYADLAARIGCSRRTVIRWSRWLADQELIVIHPRQHIYGGPDSNAISLTFWSRADAEAEYREQQPAPREQHRADLDIGIGGRQWQLDPSDRESPPLVTESHHPSDRESPPYRKKNPKRGLHPHSGKEERPSWQTDTNRDPRGYYRPA